MTRLLVGTSERRERVASSLTRQLRALPPDLVLDYWTANKVVLLASHRARQLDVEVPLWTATSEATRAEALTTGPQQELTALKVTRILAREGIRSVSIKGPLMGTRLYGAAGLRDPSSDVDVLVDPSNLHRAGRLLAAHGWTGNNDPLTHGSFPDLHFGYWGVQGEPNVELHWRVQVYEELEHATSTLDHAVVQDGVPVAAPQDLLSTLLLCFARDGFHRLRLAADIAAWFDRFGRRSWEQVGTELAQTDLARPLACATAAAARVVGTPATLWPQRPTLRTRLAAEVAAHDAPGSEGEALGQAALITALAAPRGKAARRLRTARFRTQHAHSREGFEKDFPGVEPLVRLRYALRKSVYAGRVLLRVFARR